MDRRWGSRGKAGSQYGGCKVRHLGAGSLSEVVAQWAVDELPKVQDANRCDSAMPSTAIAYLGCQSK